MTVGTYLVIVLMMATLGVLMTGIVLMGIGGAANERYGNRLMMVRVSLQGLVLLTLAALFFMAKS